MIHVTITPPILEADETWTSTEIWISEHGDMTYPFVDEVEENVNNATEFTYNTELVNGMTYYAQARYTLTPGGLQGKSMIASFVADNSEEFHVEIFYPEEIGKITVTSDFDNDIDHPHMFSNFKLETEYPVPIKHTTWVIEEAETHEVVFTSVHNTEDVNTIHLNRFLTPDVLYTIRASITTRAGIVTPFVGTSFRTAPVRDPFMIAEGGELGWAVYINMIGLIVPKAYDHFEVELYDEDHMLVNFDSTDNPIDLKEKPPFKLGRVRAHYADGTISTWRYMYNILAFTTLLKDGYIYDYPFNYPVKSEFEFIYDFPFPFGYGGLLSACKVDE